jgi:hypothetical protein
VKLTENPEDIVGKKVGKVTVVALEGKVDGRYWYTAACDCDGRPRLRIRRDQITGERTIRSCGCGQVEQRKNLQKKWSKKRGSNK